MENKTPSKILLIPPTPPNWTTAYWQLMFQVIASDGTPILLDALNDYSWNFVIRKEGVDVLEDKGIQHLLATDSSIEPSVAYPMAMSELKEVAERYGVGTYEVLFVCIDKEINYLYCEPATIKLTPPKGNSLNLLSVNVDLKNTKEDVRRIERDVQEIKVKVDGLGTKFDQNFERLGSKIEECLKEKCPPEPEVPEEVTSLLFELCDSVIDENTNQPIMGFMTVHINGEPVTDVERIKKHNIVFKATQCGKIDLQHDIALDTLLREQQYQLLSNTQKPEKLLWSLPNEEFKNLFQKFGKLGGIKFVPSVPEYDAKGKLSNYRHYPPQELIFGGADTGMRKGLENVKEALNRGSKVYLQRANTEDFEHSTQQLWDALKARVPDFRLFDSLMDGILGGQSTGQVPPIALRPPSTRLADLRKIGQNSRIANQVTSRNEQLHPLPFTNINAYRLLKSAAQAYLWATNNVYTGTIDSYIDSYPSSNADDGDYTPYLQNILSRLDEWRDDLLASHPLAPNVFGINYLPGIELIWSYWVEQGMLVQTMNAISLRFQNISTNQGTDPLSQLDIDPLRPLANLFWGYIQDEQHTLTIKRRAYEYDHTYGLSLQGRAVPTFKSVDSRSKFLEAFHNLLHGTSIYFKESDDTTRIADAFPILNNLREVHLLLAEGNHNAYGNLTWTARQEMMLQQYLLARPEMREFLGGRIMVPYREGWMDRVDRMKQIQNWGSTSITHYYDLAQYGEIILLSIRVHDWSNEESTIVAGSWATNFRDNIQRYIHSYRTVTGVDLSADAQQSEASYMQPSVLIQRRLMTEKNGPQRNSRIVGPSQPTRY
ncbi:hypothetical protein DR864_26850 [Runella rosea]|uniref:Uncharacterized protein n=1 Tax=Runella rosea TaxID=2259595 RepID=A0A344TR25_9BACT|nr:hypothetical protein [Runella rosea]AXE21096.1 hypothetical protein DR864_26850 [Runella rosea]